MLKIDNKIILSWDDVENLVDKLCLKIGYTVPGVTSVTGISRGGLIPAVMISHKLGIPYSNTITSTTLVVDDICDSGKTLKDGIGVYTAVLHFKPHTSDYSPSVWAEEHKGDEWMVYAWEKKDSHEIQDYKLKK